MPFEIFVFPFPILPPHPYTPHSRPPPGPATPSRGPAGEKWVSPAAFHTARVTGHSLTHSPFHHRRRCHNQIYQPCAAFQESSAGKVSLSPASAMIKLVFWFCLLQRHTGFSPLGILGFCTLVCTSAQVSILQIFPQTEEVVWAGVLTPLVSRSVCLSLDVQWLRLHLGPLMCGVRSHSTHQGALFVDGYLICCFKKAENKKEEHLMPPSCWRHAPTFYKLPLNY